MTSDCDCPRRVKVYTSIGEGVLPLDSGKNVPLKSWEDSMLYKVPLILSPQPEGGFTATSPLLPELVTEGDTVEETLANVRDALSAVIELYKDLGRHLPPNLQFAGADGRSG
jgi:antitoxin HicB